MLNLSLPFWCIIVLKAIAEGSSTVPKLMSDYLQSECKPTMLCVNLFLDL